MIGRNTREVQVIFEAVDKNLEQTLKQLMAQTNTLTKNLAKQRGILDSVTAARDKAKLGLDATNKAMKGSQKTVRDASTGGQMETGVYKKKKAAMLSAQTAYTKTQDAVKKQSGVYNQAKEALDSNLKSIGKGNFEMRGQQRTITTTTQGLLKNHKAVEKQVMVGGKYRTVMKSQSDVAARFKMELLGVMFLGMAMSKAFKSLLDPSLKMVGVFDIITVTLQMLFLPIALVILGWAIIFMNKVGALGEQTKLAIGWFVLFGFILGTVMMVFGQVALGVVSLAILFSSWGLIIAGVIIGIMTLLSVLAFLGGGMSSVKQLWTGVGQVIVGFIGATVTAVTGMAELADEMGDTANTESLIDNALDKTIVKIGDIENASNDWNDTSVENINEIGETVNNAKDPYEDLDKQIKIVSEDTIKLNSNTSFGKMEGKLNGVTQAVKDVADETDATKVVLTANFRSMGTVVTDDLGQPMSSMYGTLEDFGLKSSTLTMNEKFLKDVDKLSEGMKNIAAAISVMDEGLENMAWFGGWDYSKEKFVETWKEGERGIDKLGALSWLPGISSFFHGEELEKASPWGQRKSEERTLEQMFGYNPLYTNPFDNENEGLSTNIQYVEAVVLAKGNLIDKDEKLMATIIPINKLTEEHGKEIVTTGSKHTTSVNNMINETTKYKQLSGENFNESISKTNELIRTLEKIPLKIVTVHETVQRTVKKKSSGVTGYTVLKDYGSGAGEYMVGGQGFSGYYPMAAGGIVTRPTLAIIGESGPEAVVPLGRGQTGNQVISVTINMTNEISSDVDLEEVKTRLSEDLIREVSAELRR